MDYPVEVTAALRRLQGGAGTDADRQIVSDFMTQNMDTLPAQDLITMRMAVMGATGTTPGGPLRASESPDFQMPTPPTDWKAMAQGWGNALGQTAAEGAFGTPTPIQGSRVSPSDWRGMAQAQPQTQAPPTDGGMTAQDAFGSWWNARDHSQEASLSGEAGPYTQPPATPIDRPSWLPPHAADQFGEGPVLPGSTSGPGLPSVSERENFGRLMARNQRREARGRDIGRDPGKENWRNLAFGLDPNSAFAGVTDASVYKDDPYLAAYRMTGGLPQSASQLAPQVAAAMSLSNFGILSHGAKKGLGMGPSSPAGQLSQVENMIEGVGPGQFIDPQKVYQQAMRRVQNTPIEKFNTGQGANADLAEQIQVTKGALLASAPYMTQEAADGLAAQIDFASAQWLDEVGKGSTISFPEFLRTKHAKKWVSPSIV